MAGDIFLYLTNSIKRPNQPNSSQTSFQYGKSNHRLDSIHFYLDNEIELSLLRRTEASIGETAAARGASSARRQ